MTTEEGGEHVEAEASSADAQVTIGEALAIDKDELRRATFEAVSDWADYADVQHEVIAGRERAGIEKAHVPEQFFIEALDALFKEGKLDRQIGEYVAGEFVAGETGPVLRYRQRVVDRAAIVKRRGAILRLFTQPLDAYEVVQAQNIVEDLRAEDIVVPLDVVQLDLVALAEAKLVEKTIDDDDEARPFVYTLAAVTDEIVTRGCEVLVQATVPGELAPAPATDPAKPVGADFQAQLAEQLSEARSARAKAEMERDKLATFLAEKGVDVADVLGRKPVPQRKFFEWTQSRQVNEAEKGVIFDEVLKLEGKLAEIQLAADAAKSHHKAAREDVEKEIAGLKAAAGCNQRVLTVLAYRQTDWEAGVDIIRACDDDRELDREPIVKGTQKTIPGTEPVKPSSSSNGAPPSDGVGPLGALGPAEDGAAATTDGEKPPIADFRASILDVLRAATNPATHDELVAAIGGAFVCPEGFEALIAFELPKMAADGLVVKNHKAKPPTWVLADRATPPATAKPAKATAAPSSKGGAKKKAAPKGKAGKNARRTGEARA